MFDERPGGANLGSRSVTMFEDALIIIKSLGVVCVGQIENNNKLLTIIGEYVPSTRGINTAAIDSTIRRISDIFVFLSNVRGFVLTANSCNSDRSSNRSIDVRQDAATRSLGPTCRISIVELPESTVVVVVVVVRRYFAVESNIFDFQHDNRSSNIRVERK